MAMKEGIAVTRSKCALSWNACLLVILTAFVSACSTSGPDLPQMAASSPTVSYASPDAGGPGSIRMVDVLPAPPNTDGGAEQLIAANDILEVDVFQVDDLDRTVQVDAGGQISLPLIGTVAAAGKSVRSLEAEIERLYGADYLQSPEVILFVKESAGQRVTVNGEVMQAGIYPVTAGSSLLQVLAQAGGFREVADPSKVYVFREFGSETLVANFDVGDIRAGRRTDPRIFGGDKVVVFSSSSKVALQNLKEALGIATGAARLAVIP